MSDEQLAGEPGVCNDCGSAYHVATGDDPIPENLCHQCEIKMLREDLRKSNLQVDDLKTALRKIAYAEYTEHDTFCERKMGTGYCACDARIAVLALGPNGREFEKKKCAKEGPAGLFCEREPGHDGMCMGDCSKAYPKKGDV